MYPAVAVLQALGKHSHSVLWVGSEDGMEARLVSRTGTRFEGIPAAGVHGVGLAALPGNLWRLLRGFFAARRILKQFKPDVLFFTGGYVAVPMALAGFRKPILLYVPDIEPGLALKVLARFADCIGLTVDQSGAFFSSKTRMVTTGYPLREEFTRWQRPEAVQTLGLENGLPTLLVFGGSKGARSINHAILTVLPNLLKIAQVIHISGQLDWAEVETARGSLPADLAARYHAYPYLYDEMGAAMAAADLVVSRAGASTLGEFPHYGLPAVLVPYPYAWRYQKVNAEHLCSQGAAVMLEDQNLGVQLFSTIQNLLNDTNKLESMRHAMRGLARPQAANHLAELLQELAAPSTQKLGVAS